MIVTKRGADELPSWLQTPAGFIEGFMRYEDEPIVLEDFQRDFVNAETRFRWVTKSRQVGYSFCIALEALARCHIRDGHTSVFVSYNLDDAKEKILTARQVYDEMPAAFRKRLVVDSKTELAFRPIKQGARVSRFPRCSSRELTCTLF